MSGFRRTAMATKAVPAKKSAAELSGPAAGGDPVAAMKFIPIPKGTFWMGGLSNVRTSKPVQTIIAQDFELAAYPVTQSQWQALMGDNPSQFSRNGLKKERVEEVSDAELARFPVETVSWEMVQEFLRKLNERERGKGWYYRLPTEAEWEYACRNAAKTWEECSFNFYFVAPTNDLSSDRANFKGEFPAGMAPRGPNLNRPAPVGSYPPNKLGLYDMHGNVSQLCSDWYDAKREARVVRGGAWISTALACRAGHRASFRPSVGVFHVGFRLARVPSARGE